MDYVDPLTLVTTAQAASFNCEKAALPVEKLICGDRLLSKSDEKLNFAYKVVLEKSDKPDAIQHAQKQWIKERNKCLDVFCLRSKYYSRILLLDETIANHPTKVDKVDAEACQMVADYSNHGTLKSLRVLPPSDSQPSMDVINAKFDDDFLGENSYWYLDLNNDGIPDHFVINVEGTARISSGHVLSGKKGATVTHIEDSGPDLELLIVGKKYYVLSRNESELDELWRMGLDGYFHSICKYTKRSEPIIKITKGKDNPVCNAASTGKVKPVDFVAVDNERALNEEVVIGKATADIDNDGKLEDITLEDFESTAGRGFSSSMIRVVDNVNPQHAIDINNMLGFFDGENVKQVLFTYGDLTYFEEDSTGVILISHGKSELICEWGAHRLFDVQR